MKKFEEYAEAVRSGKFSQMGEPVIEMDPAPFEKPPTPVKVEPFSDSKWPLGVAILISTLVFGALLYWLYKRDIDKAMAPVAEVTRSAFVSWARKVGLGLDCQSMTVKNKRQFILNDCRFTTLTERDSQSIKPL